jgi:hypothetical protein
MSEGFIEIGKYAYRNCMDPILHVNMMIGDISRMADSAQYRDQLLGGFRAAALDVGDTETASYIDSVCPTARKILKATF